MRHGPEVPNAMTYQQRKRRRLCTTAACNKKPKRGRSKCAEHLDAVRIYNNERNRAKGMRTKEEYLSNVTERVANAKCRSRYSDRELAAIPQCRCGSRHLPPCDMEQRRIEIATMGMGTWQ